jgi:predicted PurR-regulated permease PerM
MAVNPPSQEKSAVPVRSFALTGLFVLALLFTAYLARSVLLPLTMSLFFTFLLRPVVRFLKRFRVPEAAGAALVIFSFLAVAGYAISNLSDPARQWIEKAPQSLQQMGWKMESLLSPFKKATKTAEELKKITETKNGGQVTVKAGPGLTETIVAGMREFLTQGTIMLILLFFILASGDLFLAKLMKVYPSQKDRQRVEEIVREVERSISRYLLTVTIINAAEGAVVGFGLYLIGMPDPVLWGVMAAFLIYVPYLGPLVGISIVTVVALLSIPNLTLALLAPVIYLSVEILQGQFLTPMILGARFEMNPVVIFVSLITWGAIWGVVGAIMAVPLLTIFKILCDRIEPLGPVAVFLSD